MIRINICSQQKNMSEAELREGMERHFAQERAKWQAVSKIHQNECLWWLGEDYVCFGCSSLLHNEHSIFISLTSLAI